MTLDPHAISIQHRFYPPPPLASSSLPSSLLSTLIEMASSQKSQNLVFIDPQLRNMDRSITGTLTLEECLDSYFHREVMDYSAEYLCEKCGRVVELLRDTQMEHPPQILILHLMRFAYDISGPVKLYEHVQYPLHVRLVLALHVGTRLFGVLWPPRGTDCVRKSGICTL